MTLFSTGVTVANDAIAVATIEGDKQRVKINLTDDGFSPAIVIVQTGIDTDWIINNVSTKYRDTTIKIPEYANAFLIGKGSNLHYIYPASDFGFATADHAFFGFLKTVKDLNAVDLATVKEDAAGYQTPIYPDSYYVQTDSNLLCCLTQ